MFQIKNLKLKSKEGFEVKNLQRFPSMEYGDEGGLSADLFLDGKFVGNLYQQGNGGEALFSWYNSKFEHDSLEVKTKVFEFLIRNDKDFGPQSKYDFMRDKKPESIDDDDIEALINVFENYYGLNKDINKFIKQGYQTFVFIDKGCLSSWLLFRTHVVDMAVKMNLMKNNVKYESYKVYYSPIESGF